VETEIQKVQSPKIEPTKFEVLRQETLNLIPGAVIPPFLRVRKSIKKDLIVMLVGERGGGKSGTASVITLVDYMMHGWPVFSNMNIACDIVINDETARRLTSGLLTHGGIAHYQSLPLDMPSLLRFDQKYAKSCIFIDEINVEVSEARRSMTNTNLFSNRLAQELRHMESSLIGTTISEMYMDGRLRELADCFIKCEDSAYLPENIANDKPPGIDFKLRVYFMNKCFNGTIYSDTQKPDGQYFLHFKPFQGIYNDKEFQGEGMSKFGVNMKDYSGTETDGGNLATISVKESPVVLEHLRRWGWLEQRINSYREEVERTGKDFIWIPCEEIWSSPEAKERRLAKDIITKELKNTYNITSEKVPDGRGNRPLSYVIANPDKFNG
jgi:hypothetical protein